MSDWLRGDMYQVANSLVIGQFQKQINKQVNFVGSDQREDYRQFLSLQAQQLYKSKLNQFEDHDRAKGYVHTWIRRYSKLEFYREMDKAGLMNSPVSLSRSDYELSYKPTHDWWTTRGDPGVFMVESIDTVGNLNAADESEHEDDLSRGWGVNQNIHTVSRHAEVPEWKNPQTDKWANDCSDDYNYQSGISGGYTVSSYPVANDPDLIWSPSSYYTKFERLVLGKKLSNLPNPIIWSAPLADALKTNRAKRVLKLMRYHTTTHCVKLFYLLEGTEDEMSLSTVKRAWREIKETYDTL